MENLEKCAPFPTSKICRFCLSPSGVMAPIFDNEESSAFPLSSKIMAFISIQIFANDGLPSLICHRCLYQVEKSYEFKMQCETTDAMLHKYFSSLDGTSRNDFIPKIDNPDIRDLNQFQMLTNGFFPNHFYNDSPFKRKRGRPRKEENMMFYSNSFMETQDNTLGSENNEIKLVNGVESVVTVVDPRSEMLSNSEDEVKVEPNDANDNAVEIDANVDLKSLMEVRLDSLAVAKAKAKKYMGVVFGVDESGRETRRHLCKGCGKTFGHCSDLRKHVLVHTGERPFHCQICTKNFSRSTNLNKHMKVHAGQKPFVCADCPKSFTTKGDLQRHSVIHSGIKPFSCHLCQHSFSRKDKLNRHLKLHETGYLLNKMNFRCSLCSEVYHSRVDLNEHLETCHKTKINGHVEEEDEEGNEPCNKEKQKIGEVESMIINLDPFQMEAGNRESEQQQTWPENKNPAESDTKPTTISEKIQLTLGSAITVTAVPKTKPTEIKNIPETTTKLSQCKICHRKFADENILKAHTEKSHAADKPHKCRMCEKSFNRKRELLRHENVHTGFKPFKCKTCEKAFSRKDKLVRHEKIHLGVKSYSCINCSAGFIRKEELNIHCEKYHKEKELTCNFCFKIFKSEGELLDHETLHSVSNCPPLTCYVCLRKFESDEILQQHYTTHDLEDGGRHYSNGNEEMSEEEDDINFSLNENSPSESNEML